MARGHEHDRLELLELLAGTIAEGDLGAIDAADDKDATGTDEDGRYYVVRFQSEAYELKKACNSDWGRLERGTRVVDATWLNLVYKAKEMRHWYTPHASTTPFPVPVEQVLHASLETEAAALPPRGASAQQRAAIALGATVLSLGGGSRLHVRDGRRRASAALPLMVRRREGAERLRAWWRGWAASLSQLWHDFE